MPERSHNYITIGDSSQEGDKISPEVLEKFLRQVPDEPMKQVEEIILPEPWSPSQLFSRPKRIGKKRGPKSYKEWTTEVRKDWGNLNDEEKLAESWLALFPSVQKLASAKYGGRDIGKGLALQEIFRQALLEAQKYSMEDATREVLKNYPELTMTKIASQLKLDRAHLSRRYRTRATDILISAFLRIIDQSKK